MKLFKRTVVDFEKETEQKNEQKSANKIFGSVKGYLNPSVFSRENILKQIPFFIFLAMLAVLSIGNQYHAEKVVNDVERLKKIRNEKRAEFISSASDLMRITRQSQVLKLVEEQNLGLKPLVSPPKRIRLEKQ